NVIFASDYVIEMGPGAGDAGGQVVFKGQPEALARADTQWGALARAACSTARTRGNTAELSK
ncbi:MAG TPA: hypothetical protein PLL10_07930, partial [Elusimicrobiales bacterium]|nr:hypothetical protein [Elusimicrobiales bacterium]